MDVESGHGVLITSPAMAQERRAILARSQAGQTAPQIAADLGWSVHAIRKWRRIVCHNDDAALSPRIGRAPTGAVSTP